MANWDVIIFKESGSGTPTEIVARKSTFKSKEDFFNLLKANKLDDDFNPGYYEVDFSSAKLEDVEELFVRYYPRLPDSFDLESGYTYCRKGKGAFGVYAVKIKEYSIT